MKERYVKPEMMITEYVDEDIIVTSGEGGTDLMSIPVETPAPGNYLPGWY